MNEGLMTLISFRLSFSLVYLSMFVIGTKLDPAAWIRHHWTTFKKPMEGIGSTENTTVDDQDTLGRLSYSRSSTLLRRERRMARNRFLFMFFAFLALLSAILFFMRP